MITHAQATELKKLARDHLNLKLGFTINNNNELVFFEV